MFTVSQQSTHPLRATIDSPEVELKAGLNGPQEWLGHRLMIKYSVSTENLLQDAWHALNDALDWKY